MRLMKANKLFINFFFFDCNEIMAFKVFKWTAGSIFKCETTKMKFAKNVKKMIFK